MTRKVCIECKVNLAEKKSEVHFYKKCTSCRKRGKAYYKHYSSDKRKSCECCGFVAVHPCQLDVDHVDGDRNNNDIQNLQTLCANCHRLKTVLNRDNTNRYTDDNVKYEVPECKIYNLKLF
jgi:hypothetical protein